MSLPSEKRTSEHHPRSYVVRSAKFGGRVPKRYVSDAADAAPLEKPMVLKHNGWTALVCVLFTTPPASAAYNFLVDNDCHTPATVHVRFKDLDGVWQTSGSYLFAPGASAFLLDRNGQRIASNNATFYYYAEAVGTGGYSWRGSAADPQDRTYFVDGEPRRFRHKHDTWRHNNFRLVCTNLAPPPRLSAYLLALTRVAELRYVAGRTVAADDIVAKVSENARQQNGFLVSGLGGGGGTVAEPPGPFCPGGLSEEECDFVQQTVRNEGLKEDTASVIGWAAGATCGAGVAAIPGAGWILALPAGLLCNVMANSATRTIFNCSISKAQRSIIRRITGRKEDGCIEVGFGIEWRL